MVYNDKGEPKDGTGFLDGQLPHLPQGVFDYARQHKQNRVTWQPRSAIRQAVVITTIENNGGFVAAGRSLTEIENRVQQLQTIVLIVWLACLAIIGLTTLLTRKK